MSKRQASPTPSENEMDIVGALVPDADAFRSDDDELPKKKRQKRLKATLAVDEADLDMGAILDGGAMAHAARGALSNGLSAAENDAAEEEADEAYIALQQAAAFRKSSNLRGDTGTKGGGFQAMGLHPNLLRAIKRKGFSGPTPIQRKTIPLILARRDVVGMARTGSGKTAAFVIPMVQRLRAHSVRVGARALVLSPSRELALQTLKVVRELGHGTDLRTVLLVGGDSLEDQFGLLASNPDIVIATPGRFLHLKVEMGLDLASIRYVVFDEADRLFEMGFAAQLTEILHALPPSRQTLLFSATLPSSLVEFARAGLQDPSLVRLDVETKISPDLQSAFFSVKGAEKEGALLHLLHDVIGVPLGVPEDVGEGGDVEEEENDDEEEDDDDAPNKRKKKKNARKTGAVRRRDTPTKHSTIVFASTKHHVEYLAALLREAGFAVSYVYGSLDQTARKIQIETFRRGRSHVLVVTDLAARGLDIPVLANVVNYDFPPQAKVFVHRVGRTARAGQTGWSYSLVQDADAPYLVDLQLFLGRRLVVGADEDGGAAPDYSRDVVVGALARDAVERHVEWVNTLLADVADVEALRAVAAKAQKQYFRTRLSASSQSARRARALVGHRAWSQLHRLFAGGEGSKKTGATDGEALQREDLLAKITGYKPQESIFEVTLQGKRATKSDAAEIMRTMRRKAGPRRRTADTDLLKTTSLSTTVAAEKKAREEGAVGDDQSDDDEEVEEDDDDDDAVAGAVVRPMESNDADWSDEEEDEDDDEDEDEDDNTKTKSKKPKTDAWVDRSVFMTYTPRTGGDLDARAAEARGYGVHHRQGDDGDDDVAAPSFAAAARDATMDLTNDETAKAFGVPTRSKLRWDKKAGKYVARANDEDGSRLANGTGKAGKMIRGESGVKIAASFQSGRFDKWRRAHRLGALPHVGDTERSSLARQLAVGPSSGSRVDTPGGRFYHRKELAPKDADKYRDDYAVRKKRVAEAKEKRIGRFRDGDGSRRELKDADDIRKARAEAEQKRLKNERAAGRGGGGGRGGRGGRGGGRGGARDGGGRGGGGRGGGRGGRGRGGRGGGRGR